MYWNLLTKWLSVSPGHKPTVFYAQQVMFFVYDLFKTESKSIKCIRNVVWPNGKNLAGECSAKRMAL